MVRYEESVFYIAITLTETFSEYRTPPAPSCKTVEEALAHSRKRPEQEEKAASAQPVKRKHMPV
jgi:hypothetical protein